MLCTVRRDVAVLELIRMYLCNVKFCLLGSPNFTRWMKTGTDRFCKKWYFVYIPTHIYFGWALHPSRNTDTSIAQVLSVFYTSLNSCCSWRDISRIPCCLDNRRSELYQGKCEVLRFSCSWRWWSDFDPTSQHSWKNAYSAPSSDCPQVVLRERDKM